MPQDKKWTGGSIRVTEEAIQNIRKIAKRSGLIQPEILDTLINMCVVHDLLNPDWQERLNAALERGAWLIQRKKHLASKERCDGLRDADLKWKCIQGRKNMTPMIRILAEDYEDALNLCEGCTVTLEPILKNYEYQEKIQQLENQIQINVGQKFKAPVCNRGAILTNDGLEFKSCPARSYDKTVDIKTWCKVFNRDTPCFSYAEIVIAVADKKSEYGSESNI